MRQSDIRKALFDIDPDREIEEIKDGKIVFSDGEILTIEDGVKQYNCEILGDASVDDPETYPDYVHEAFAYYNHARAESPCQSPESIASSAAIIYGEYCTQGEFILHCFRASYPELKAAKFPFLEM